MPSVLAYHRPTSLDEAVDLLSDSNRWALAGGTVVVPEARKNKAEGVEVVDLQALGLGAVDQIGSELNLGAMVRLGDLEADDRTPALIKEAAHRELPSALRNQATVGGTIASADPDSLLIAALLVHEAKLEVHQQPSVSLADYLAGNRQGLIVAVAIETEGVGSMATTGRTPSDIPIVAAVARSANSGTHLALTGVAATPIAVDPESPTAALSPPGDFRGSSEYRTHLASVLSSRALQEVK